MISDENYDETESYETDFSLVEPDESQIQIESYSQREHVSNSHALFEFSLLSQFAEGIDNALTEILPKDNDNFYVTLNSILDFVQRNSYKVKHMNYKNPEMFVIGYFCYDFRNGGYNVGNLKKYSKKYNINNIIRYCHLISGMNEDE